MDDSDDSDDFLNDTVKWRSQATPRYIKLDLKPSKLSLSYRSSQPINSKPKVSKVESVPSQAKTTPSKTRTSSKTKRTPPKSSKTKIKKGTPVKSRADHPEENCTAYQRAQWEFLFGSQSCKIEKPTPQKRKGGSEGESSKDSFSSGSHYKKRNNSGECSPHCTNEKQDDQRCCHCSFPFKTYRENPHNAFLCSTTDFSNLPRCDKEGQCQEITEQHFLKFNHRKSSLVKINLLCNDVNSNTLVKTNPITSTPRCDVTGPSTSMVSSVGAASDDQFSVITVKSENEASTLPGYKDDSSPLFDLEEIEDHKAPLDKDLLTSENQDHSTPLDEEPENSENSHVSSNLLDCIPDIDLDVDDQETVCFDNEHLHATSSTKEDRQENQKSPLNHDNSSVSEKADLKNSETAADALEDPEGDELIASLSEEAIDQFAIPLLEKIIKWRKNCEEAQANVPANENNPSTGLKKKKNIVIQPGCIHFHYHEANPVQSHSKENGQTSILNYFAPKNSKEERYSCSEKKMASKQENSAAWQRLMGHKQKRSLVPLPPVSQNSSSENSSTLLSKTQRNTATRQRWGRRGTAEPKNCPFYKYIPDTSFVVDAFSYGSVDGVTAYFLSHFHYDHYCGLQRNFSHPIYCSEITARLVNKRLGVHLQYLNPLPMWKPQEVCGVEVTLLDANHCPGAVMFLFKVKPGVRHLHVGDFRAHPSMERYPALQCPIHSLFLDTTYCSPEHDFPTQEKMIEKCVSLAQDHYLRNAKTLFVVGSYTIGKERVFKAIASNLNSSIWVKDYKKQVLNCINDKNILARLTQSKTSAMVHVLPMSEVKGQKLREYLNQLRSTFTEIVGICPTGWEFTSSSNVDDISEHPYPDVYIYGIPYSEHSNFSELRRFVQFIKPRKIIPTVNNGSQASRKKMEQYFLEWQTKRHFFS